MASRPFAQQENVILRYPPVIWAGVVLLLSSFVGRECFDVAASLGGETGPLLNLSSGRALPATFTTLVAAKLAAFLLFWGWLKRFEQAQKLTGGVFSVFVLSLDPLFAANSGRLGLFIGVLTLFWWSWVYAASSRVVPEWIAPVSVALAGSVLLSPWYLVLLSLLPLFRRSPFQTRRWSTVRRITLRCLGLLVVIGVIYLLCFPTDARNLLNPQYGFWVEHLRYFFLSVSAVHVWGAVILSCFGFGLVAWYYPEIIFLLLGISVGVLGLTKLDLGGLVLLWAVLCPLVGTALELRWKPLIKARSVARSNLLLVILTAAMLYCCRGHYTANLLLARQQYRTGFASGCGQWAVPEHGSPEDAVLTINEPGDHQPGCYLAFGNYHNVLPGRYSAAFYLCHTATSASKALVNVAQHKGRTILATAPVPVTASCRIRPTSPAVVLTYDIVKNPLSSVEHRVYYGGTGQLVFHYVDINSAP
jgi:hypothetical protein